MAELNPQPGSPILPTEPSGSWLARNRQSVILGGVAVGLLIIIGVTSLIRNRHTGTTVNTNTGNSNTSTGSVGSSNTNSPTFRRYQASGIDDRDRDGLSDSQEAQYHTDPNKADTDGDGLTDYEEVVIYQTNPLVSDTDGDRQSDGQEVRSGSNPNGPGQLRDLSQAINQLKNTNQ